MRNRMALPVGTLIIAAAFLLAPAPALRAGQETKLSISGRIKTVCQLSVDPLAGAGGIQIGGGTSEQTVATVSENCNNEAGYSISIATLNGLGSGFATGQIKGRTAKQTDSTDYLLNYNGLRANIFNRITARTRVSPIRVTGHHSPVDVQVSTGEISQESHGDVVNVTLTVN